MLTMRFLGSTARLSDSLAKWPQIAPVGGHTDVLIDPKIKSDVRLAKDIFAELVVEHRWTALDTTDKEAPVRVVDTTNLLAAGEVVLIPQIAGG